MIKYLVIAISLFIATTTHAATYAQVFQTLLTQQRATGAVLAAGKVYFYTPGTSNLATVYTDRNMGTPAANPYTLSADGTAAVYGNGQYDVKITTSAGVQKFYWYGVSLVDASVATSLDTAFRNYTAIDRMKSSDGRVAAVYDVANYSSLPAAITAIGATKATLRYGSDQTLVDDLTVPVNVELQPYNGAIISIASGKVLTIAGNLPQKRIQLFTGDGTVSITFGQPIYPDWWGDVVTDLGIPLNKAIDSIRTRGGEILLPQTDVNLLTSVNLTDGGTSGTFNHSIKISGSSRTTMINAQLTGVAFDCTGAQFLDLRDFTITGNASTTPSTAFLFARNSTGNSAGRNHMDNVTAQGSYTVATLYNYASEEFRANNVYLINNSDNVPVAIFTANNMSSVSSTFVTIATGQLSSTEYSFYGSAINQYSTTGTANSLVLQGVSNFRFENGFMANNTNAYIKIDATDYSALHLAFRNLMLDGNGSATYGVLLVGTNEVSKLELRNILDYAIKTRANGGYSLYAGTDTILSNVSLENFAGVANNWKSYRIQFSELNFGSIYASLDYASEGNRIIANSGYLTIARPDLSYTNNIFYNNKGWTGNGLNKIALLAAAPTTEVWAVGDKISNSTPSAGQPKGWFCTVAGGANSTTRGNTTAYSQGVYAIWATGTTVWECTTAGTSAGSAPSIVGKVVGDTVTDGTAVWTMRSLTTATFVSEGNL